VVLRQPLPVVDHARLRRACIEVEGAFQLPRMGCRVGIHLFGGQQDPFRRSCPTDRRSCPCAAHDCHGTAAMGLEMHEGHERHEVAHVERGPPLASKRRRPRPARWPGAPRGPSERVNRYGGAPRRRARTPTIRRPGRSWPIRSGGESGEGHSDEVHEYSGIARRAVSDPRHWWHGPLLRRRSRAVDLSVPHRHTPNVRLDPNAQAVDADSG